MIHELISTRAAGTLNTVFENEKSEYRQSIDKAFVLAKQTEHYQKIDDAYSLAISAAAEAAYRQGMIDGLNFKSVLQSGQQFVNHDRD